MQKMIFQYSYWLGMLCAGVAVVMRILVALGIGVSQLITTWYGSFYRGSLLLLFIAIASACSALFANQKQQG
jgi:hypothetical protein